MKNQLLAERLLVFAPSRGANSETFIRNNLKRLPFHVDAYFGDEISLDNLIDLIIKENKFKSFKVFTNHKKKDYLFFNFISNYNKKNNILNNYNINICSKIKTNIVSILSYSSVGC